MTGKEFLTAVRKYARRRNLPYEFLPQRGKGSHGVLLLGERRTVVKDRRKELPKGTLHAMLKQLGISIADLRE